MALKRPLPHEGPYTMGQVADILGVNKSTLDRWERKGKIPKAPRVSKTGERKYSDELLKEIREICDRDKELVDKWEDTEAARKKASS